MACLTWIINSIFLRWLIFLWPKKLLLHAHIQLCLFLNQGYLKFLIWQYTLVSKRMRFFFHRIHFFVNLSSFPNSDITLCHMHCLERAGTLHKSWPLTFYTSKKWTLLNTLTWLQINNLLYRDSVINHDILLSILNEYIPEGILSRVIIMENNSFQRKSYRANLVENNYKNYLHCAIKAAGIRILSNCFYIDINKSKQNP